MKSNLKKMALFGLTAGFSCLCAEDLAQEEFLGLELQMEENQEITMGGQCEDYIPGSGDSRSKGSRMNRDGASCKAPCSCGTLSGRDSETCKKPSAKRRSAAQKAMDD